MILAPTYAVAGKTVGAFVPHVFHRLVPTLREPHEGGVMHGGLM